MNLEGGAGEQGDDAEEKQALRQRSRGGGKGRGMGEGASTIGLWRT